MMKKTWIVLNESCLPIFIFTIGLYIANQKRTDGQWQGVILQM